MSFPIAIILCFAVLATTVSCGPQPAQPTAGQGAPAEQRASRTLRTVMRTEPPALASKPLAAPGISIRHATRLFNAELDFLDGGQVDHPYLAEALPRLNTDSWKVFADGRMETSYRLRPNATW